MNLGLESLRRDIDEGWQDVKAGRLVSPDIDDIMARGRRLYRAIHSSASSVEVKLAPRQKEINHEDTKGTKFSPRRKV
jgi:hypothetical protein